MDGFIIGTLEEAPPVYDPGGLTCIVDDFVVAAPSNWQGAGQELLAELIKQTRNRGVVQIVVVCGHRDQPKRTLLASCRFSLASEWYVKGI